MSISATKALGDKCECPAVAASALSNTSCCGEGLICSATSKTCKYALGAPCTRKSLGTHCAVSSYGYGHSGIGCHKHKVEKDYKCCIPGLPRFIDPANALSDH